MINDTVFAQSFRFTTFNYNKFRYNDNRMGAQTHYIAYMIRGSARLVTESEQFSITEGDVFYIPRGLKYESFWSGEPNIEFASLGFKYLPAFNSENFKLQLIDADDTCKKSIVELAGCEALSCEKIGALYTIFGSLIPKMQHSSKDKTNEFLIRVKQYIAKNPNESVAKIAKRFAVSESGLYSIFKKHSDKSIGEYREAVVMNNAKELLISSDTPIEAISDKLGFSSSSYFRKRFKAHFGSSPREVRKKSGI